MAFVWRAHCARRPHTGCGMAGPPSQADAATEKWTVDPKLLRWIVGPKGANIKKLSEVRWRIRSVQSHLFLLPDHGAVRARFFPQKFEHINLTVPSSEDKSDVIILRGPKAEVDVAKKEVAALIEEARRQEELNSYVAEVLLDREFVKFIIGKDGAAINKVSAAHNVRIDVEKFVAEEAAKPAEKAKAPAAAGAAAGAAAVAAPAADKGKAPAAGKAADKGKAPAPAAAAAADKGKAPAAAADKGKAAAVAAPPAGKDKLIIRGQKEGVEAAKKELLLRIKELVRLRAGPGKDASVNGLVSGARIQLGTRGAVEALCLLDAERSNCLSVFRASELRPRRVRLSVWSSASTASSTAR